MDIILKTNKENTMSIWNKTLYTTLGAAIGAGVVYYLTQKDTEDFQLKLDALNENTKEGCDAIREWFATDKSANS